ncbi:asparagine synthetase B family protein [Clostridium brassicae]|uniref:asparagine synthase (glutamine-hydrolyzing) n=1 Tax=Clostridium brassicae TaxID=2999072 RepID=A0ABT4DBB0_9CLOT|nr:hypothetical protein [Clostridium brassicae]MCY6959570.1 hypothetical protein [Clostridium brassicae]
MSLLLVNQLKNNNKLFELANYGKHKYLTCLAKEINIGFINDEVLFKQDDIVSNESDTLIGFMLGEIYDTEDKKYDLKSKGHIFKSNLDIEYVMHLYEEYGEDELKRFNGKFIICIYDKVKKETIIVNDRYGYYTYFYSVNKGKYTFCNDPNVLLYYIEKRELNQEAVNEFFNFGYLLDNKTLFKNINKLEPASIVKLKNNEVLFDKYWEWTDIKKTIDITYEQAVEKLGLLWIKSIKKIMNKHEKFILPLSGGLDSRAILAAIDFLGFNNKIEKAVTIGQENCWDYLIAKKVCEISNIKHELLHINEKIWLQVVNETIVNSIGGIYCACGIIEKSIGRDICRYPILNGLAGDLVLGGSFLSEKVLSSKVKYNEYCYKCLKSSGLSNINVIKKLNNINLQIDDVDFIKGSIDYYFLNNSRVKNFTVTGALTHGTNYNDIIPFFDNDLIEFIYSLPDKWKLDSQLYKNMLIKFFPKFYLDIPWQKTGKSIKKIGIYTFNLKKIKIKKYNEKLVKMQKSNKSIVLFGASNYGKKSLLLLKLKYKNIVFCDNDSSKWGKYLEGYKIISPKELLKYKSDFIFITSMYYKEISIQLETFNIYNYRYFSVANNKKFLYSSNFIHFSDWIKKDNIRKEIYNTLLDNDCSGFYNTYEIKKLLDNHMNRNVDSWIDILILYTFKKFYQIYFDTNLK